MFFRRKKRVKPMSAKGKLTITVKSLFRKILLLMRGWKCEICGKVFTEKNLRNLTVFHVLPTGQYPRLRFHFENVLLACWHPCHFNWHHDHEKGLPIKKRVKELLGKDYKARLEKLDARAPKMTGIRIELIYVELTKRLEALQNEAGAQPENGELTYDHGS